MDKFHIRGGKTLMGTVRVSGAKNAVLPALAACLLTDQTVTLRNIPRVRDVRTMFRVLEHLGAEAVVEEGTTCRVTVKRLKEPETPYDLVKTMRASVLVLGPLLARFGRARVSMPGGCAIGERPIDMHLAALRRLGASVEMEHGYVEARAGRLRGAEITFDQKTVTGTENALMAGTLASGTTTLWNCAEEPEVAGPVALRDLACRRRAASVRTAHDVHGGHPLVPVHKHLALARGGGDQSMQLLDEGGVSGASRHRQIQIVEMLESLAPLALDAQPGAPEAEPEAPVGSGKGGLLSESSLPADLQPACGPV